MLLVEAQLPGGVVVREQLRVAPPVDDRLELAARLLAAERVLEIVDDPFRLDCMARIVLELAEDVADERDVLEGSGPEDRLLLVELDLGEALAGWGEQHLPLLHVGEP